MRAVDRLECAALGHSPKQALRLGLQSSTDIWTAKVDGVPHAMFGLTPISLLDGEGRPWFLGSDETYRHGRAMIGIGPRVIARWLDSTPHLANVVSAGNFRAIRLLERWGFIVGSETKVIGGHPFLDFWMTR